MCKLRTHRSQSCILCGMFVMLACFFSLFCLPKSVQAKNKNDFVIN